ncbi:MAG: hypothetical protein WCD86_10440, partial [Ktedonobacteraceae bacterium]
MQSLPDAAGQEKDARAHGIQRGQSPGSNRRGRAKRQERDSRGTGAGRGLLSRCVRIEPCYNACG